MWCNFVDGDKSFGETYCFQFQCNFGYPQVEGWRFVWYEGTSVTRHKTLLFRGLHSRFLLVFHKECVRYLTTTYVQPDVAKTYMYQPMRCVGYVFHHKSKNPYSRGIPKCLQKYSLQFWRNPWVQLLNADTSISFARMCILCNWLNTAFVIWGAKALISTITRFIKR